MTIYEMLFREDIYGIMEKTLEKYYKEVWDKDVLVKIEKSVFRNKFVIYPRLGIALSRFPSWKVAKDIYGQFSVQGNLIKKLVAWVYITICFLTGGMLSCCSMKVSDLSVLNRNLYIMPCNRKIRIFDYKHGYVDAILKVGFNDLCFQNELKFRVNLKYFFIPGLMNSGKGWYREQIMKGLGLVRVPEPEYSLAVEQVKKDLEQLYSNTINFVPAKEYAKNLSEIVNTYIPLLRDQKHIISTEYVISVVDKCLLYIMDCGLNVPVVLSHGDLQTGNIMVCEKGVMIYDWETAGERSIWYDMGRFLLYSQRKGKYAEMINRRNDDDIKSALMSFDSYKNYDMNQVISVLVLEELVAFIEEIRGFPDDMGTEIMDRLTNELKQTDLFK